MIRQSPNFALIIATLTLMSLPTACRTPADGSQANAIGEQIFASDDSASPALVTYDQDFLFGVATAPAHVEDELDDVWLEFAKDKKKNGVKAWHNAGYPELRLKFWTDYKTEIDLAKHLGVKVFRMGIDWGRLVPKQPINTCPEASVPCFSGIQDQAALAHYREIIRYVRKQGMSVMLTLFHHSPPVWLSKLKVDHAGKGNSGGWTNPDAPLYFEAFSRDAVTALKADVDIWVIFNEPAIFASLAYGAGIWPPAEGTNYLAMFKIGLFEGAVLKAFNYMIDAHKRVYAAIKSIDNVSTNDAATRKLGSAYVGIAHNVGYHTARNLVSRPIASYMRTTLNYQFIDGIIEQLDFLGLNYYGEEPISPTGVPPVPEKEYSESGRAVNPQGFYITLMQFYERYLKKRNIPVFITENGISDETDVLRPSYLIEHLLALDAARAKGVDVMGYVFWTISDNWEWADGYCPKFGLVAVDRTTPQLKRTRRPSFELYRKIVETRRISQKQRDDAWDIVKANVGRDRPFCRSSDGQNSLDFADSRAFVNSDWRFTIPAETPVP